MFGCDRAVDVHGLARADTGVVSLLCTGQLPPSFIDYALRAGADGVVVTGCAEDGCYYRHGNRWTAQRLRASANPTCVCRYPRERVRVAWAAAGERARLEAEIEDFRRVLAALPPAAVRRAARPKRREAVLG
ncbi:MAG: hydrogenase iron-sulfur subunit [Burkholderiales bacterium]|nr:hydrogenase iron-sulfur subunit [Burkholderiales bacterium]